MKARIPKGMGGGPGNMTQMLQQAQKVQEEMEKYQATLEEREFQVTAGGGMVEVLMNGKKQLRSITLKPEIVDPDDIEMLQDVIVAAVNEASNTVDETVEAETAKITGSLNIPGIR